MNSGGNGGGTAGLEDGGGRMRGYRGSQRQRRRQGVVRWVGWGGGVERGEGTGWMRRWLGGRGRVESAERGDLGGPGGSDSGKGQGEMRGRLHFSMKVTRCG